MSNIYNDSKKGIQLLLYIGMVTVQMLFAQTADAPSLGDGTSGNPYQIATLNNLYWIIQTSSSWNKYFIQTVDIDASSTTSWYSGTGFMPISNFSGTYNGSGHTISGLYINRSSQSYVGLFGNTISNAYVHDLGVINVNFNATGSVYSGGLVGLMSKTTISNCYSSGSVNGLFYVGGLIGEVDDTSVVSNSYSHCIVNGTYVAGGLVGDIYDLSTISNCYSTGSVNDGWTNSGGLVAAVSSSTITNCFWDKTTSGKISSAGGIGKTTSEMKTISTFTDAGWDFEGETTNGTNNYWDLDIIAVINSGYPYLSWQDGASMSLPVELFSFKVISNGQGFKLVWETATEVNNFGFEVERRAAENRSLQVNGSLEWQKVGFVEGNGTTNTPKEYSFIEKNISFGKYSYRLKQIDRDGKFEYSGVVEAIVAEIKTFGLEQNYPNPFNPVTIINYQLPMNSLVTMRVYDAIGREVATLVNEVKEAGNYTAQFNGSKLSRQNAGGLASGIYFYTLRAGNFTATKKLTLLK